MRCGLPLHPSLLTSYRSIEVMNRYTATGLELDARRTQRQLTAKLLRSGRTPLRVIEAAQSAAALADSVSAEASARQPPRKPLACREGCSWCCYKLVGTAVPEVERLIDYIHTAWSEAQRSALKV